MKLAKYSVIAAAVVALGACGKKDAAPTGDAAHSATSGDHVVLIGHGGPLTGNQAHLGKDNENGVRLAIEDLNKDGVLIGGQKYTFELKSEDDQATPQTATVVAQRLVDAKVAAVIGHMNSGTTIPASKIYAEAGIPQISPSATAVPYTNQRFATTFRVIANDLAQGKALGTYAAQTLHAKKVAIIDDRTAYGQGLADEFEKAAKANGVDIVQREFTTNQATDFMAILTNVKAKKPDLIFYGGMDPQAAPMAQQMKKLGIAARLIGGDGFQDAAFLKNAGDAAEGQYASQPGLPKDKMPGFEAFNKRYQARFNADIQIYGPFAYDAMMVLVEAMKRAGSTEPSKYLKEISKTDYNGITGHITFDNKGDLKAGAVTIYQVKGGKWETVATVNAADSQ
ncbi:branched-chain amino acid ABC transporter substrate-binding protein [Burkholderiaceae bacterium DAT-1]|nr:branched-chain amino acid ABC transporter substrate-binding protein [Burkholderiaceae bacterium DAT-1]